MRGELVAIDLETTGLDANQDEIIEIGAVRVVDGQVVAEYSTLVQPGRTIPALVTTLTGITNDSLIGAPNIRAVLSDLQKFVGTAPLLGHNVGFDAGFLAKQGLFHENARIDTYELASVLLPTTPRYALSHLTALFGFDIESAHRALYDARATAFVFAQLWERALALPLAALHEIVALSEGVVWDGRSVFVSALETRLARGERVETGAAFPAFSLRAPTFAPLTSSSTSVLLNGETIAALFEEGGALAAHLPHYERRIPQIEMARAVVEALNAPHHAMIEAGTGTGKSFAYLIPALLWAVQNNTRVVIATHTINLQDQLIAHDLPALASALGVDFRAAVLKGRANYLCPIEFEHARRTKPNSVETLRAIAKTRVWLDETVSGDRAELSLRGPEENTVWQHMSAENNPCALERCETIGGACPFYRARRAAEHAHLLIVNHALLLADAMSDNAVIPPYDTVVIDEAHHLEEAVTNSLARRIDETKMKRHIWELGDLHSGLLGRLIETITVSAPPKTVERFTAFVGDIGGVLRSMRAQITRLFATLRALLQELSLNQETNGSVRLTPNIRARTEFAAVQLVWHDLSEYCDGVVSALDQVIAAGSRIESLRASNQGDLFGTLAGARRGLIEMRALMDELLSAPKSNAVYWLQVGQTHEYIALHTAPLHIGESMQAHLWSVKRAVILTSATLRAGNEFKYWRDRLNADPIQTVEIGSPFDFTRSTLLYLPEDMPDPNDKQRYQQAVERALIDLTSALDGRVLALFTSYAHLRQTAYAISPRLALGNIAVYDQSDGSSRQALIDGFKGSERAILMGTRSFWEGIDIPGESLSAVVIMRLPFSVPTDPVFASRSERYQDSFNEFTMPDAIVRFRQGFGRLIRTQTDHGIVVVLDARVISKSYGHNFIDALPEPTIQRGLLSGLPDAARAWMARRA